MKKIVLALAAAAALASVPIPASAEDIDKNVVAYCMISNSGPKETQAMKSMLLAALQDDKEGAQEAVAELSGVIFRMATKCGLTLKDMGSDEFPGVAEAYGALLGERVMNEALKGI